MNTGFAPRNPAGRGRSGTRIPLKTGSREYFPNPEKEKKRKGSSQQTTRSTETLRLHKRYHACLINLINRCCCHLISMPTATNTQSETKAKLTNSTKHHSGRAHRQKPTQKTDMSPILTATLQTAFLNVLSNIFAQLLQAYQNNACSPYPNKKKNFPPPC